MNLLDYTERVNHQTHLPFLFRRSETVERDVSTADAFKLVAQVSNLLYRGFPIRRPRRISRPDRIQQHCRLEVGDTEGWKPAPRPVAAILASIILLLLIAFPSPAQTNSAARAGAPMQVWDYADQLGLSKAQGAEMKAIREQYEKARADLQTAKGPDVPPDAQRAAQLNFNDQFRISNRRIAELLTDEQKAKLTALRKERVTARTVPAASEEKADATTNTEDESAASMVIARKAPRPALSAEEYRKLAVELRAAYSQPSAKWPAPNIDDEVKPHFVEIGLLPLVSFPTNNPYSEAKTALGQKLFFEPRLSGSGQITCASCHDPDLAFADGRTVSFGHKRTELKRNAPTILNTAFNQTLFWDGRADSLEQQVSDVVNNQDEMHSKAESVRDTLGKLSEYTNEFATVFGSSEITLSRVAQAIATFERTVTSRGNNFDSFLRGDTDALSDEAVRGLHLFRTTARCINCHNGPNFTDGRFHNEGLTYYGRKYEDLGRYNVTHETADVGKFKTPSLRNIGRTAPYMHNGLFDLDGVINMYNAGMATVRRRPSQKDDPLFPVKSPLLQPLGLNQQDHADLKAFLESLTETRFRLRPPKLPEDKTSS